MTRTLRALVALLVLAGLVSPLLGACLCTGMVREAEGHGCCRPAADSWLQAAYDCCLDDGGGSQATMSPVKALAAPLLAPAAEAVDLQADLPPVRPHSLPVSSRPLVLRI